MLLDIDNPIWFREKRAEGGRSRRLPLWKRTARAGVLSLWIIPMGLVLWLSMRYSSPLDRDLIAPVLCSAFLQIIYISVRSIIVGSAAIARERDLQTWETLLSTPIGLARLVTGKYLAVVLPLLGEVALASPFLLLFLVAGDGPADCLSSNRLVLIANIVGLNLACILFFGAFGLFISACSPSTTRAAVRAVVAAACLFGGTWMLDLFLATSSHGPQFLQPYTSFLNPIVAQCSFIFAQPTYPRHGMYEPMVGYGTLVAYGVLTLVFLCWTRIRLTMESGR